MVTHITNSHQGRAISTVSSFCFKLNFFFYHLPSFFLSFWLCNSTSKLDGISIWQALSNDEISPRKSILHNIDDIWGSSALAKGDWKVVKGTNYKGAWDGWYGPAGDRDARSYDYKAIRNCYSGRALQAINMLPTTADITRMRSESNIDCSARMANLKQGTDCKPLIQPCLFNVRDDPCEKYNLAQK